jgi:hypothetical protein
MLGRWPGKIKPGSESDLMYVTLTVGRAGVSVVTLNGKSRRREIMPNPIAGESSVTAAYI